MKIANEFTVSAPIDRAWEVLTDLEQVIPLMPGAQLVGQEGDDYLGKVKVKVGPVTSEFSGKAHFVEQDREAAPRSHRRQGQGGPRVRATRPLPSPSPLHEAGDRQQGHGRHRLKIVGKLAQFGSGMLQQVSEKLLGQFVDSLEAQLAGGHTEAGRHRLRRPMGRPSGRSAGAVLRSISSTWRVAAPSRSTGRRFSVLSCWRLSSSRWDGCAWRERRCAGTDDRAVAATRRRPGGLRYCAGQPAARRRCRRVRQRPSRIR